MEKIPFHRLVERCEVLVLHILDVSYFKGCIVSKILSVTPTFKGFSWIQKNSKKQQVLFSYKSSDDMTLK